MKKFISVFMALTLILLCFSSCSDDNTEEDTTYSFADSENTSNLTLAYTKSDSLDPYDAKSQLNIQISSLVFDGFFKLDSSYEPQAVVAKSASINGISVTVILNNVYFSDGTRVTAQDAEYSFYKAKESDYYSAGLENFSEFYVSSENVVMITMARNDPYALSCLDFPIVKRNVSEDDLPIGSGRYKFAKDGDNLYLVVNTGNQSFNPAIKTISLEAVHDYDYLDSSLVVGNTAIYCNDLSSGEYKRINANTVEMGLNNLIYLGFNPTSLFAYSDLRQALSLALDRNYAVSGAFQSHARGSALPFNPDWFAVSAYTFDLGANSEKAAEIIENSGVNVKSEEIVILYNSDNGFKKELASYLDDTLESLGFYSRIYGVEADEFKNEVRYGNYDIYIGECRLTQNMDLYPLFTGSSNFGLAEGSESNLAYDSFVDGKIEIMDFINTFNSDVPFVPVCFRNAAVSYTRAIYGDFAPCDRDLFYDIESWSIR